MSVSPYLSSSKYTKVTLGIRRQLPHRPHHSRRPPVGVTECVPGVDPFNQEPHLFQSLEYRSTYTYGCVRVCFRRVYNVMPHIYIQDSVIQDTDKLGTDYHPKHLKERVEWWREELPE